MKRVRTDRDTALGEHFPLILATGIISGVIIALVAGSPIAGAASGVGIVLVFLGVAALLIRRERTPSR